MTDREIIEKARKKVKAKKVAFFYLSVEEEDSSICPSLGPHLPIWSTTGMWVHQESLTNVADVMQQKWCRFFPNQFHWKGVGTCYGQLLKLEMQTWLLFFISICMWQSTLSAGEAATQWKQKSNPFCPGFSEEISQICRKKEGRVAKDEDRSTTSTMHLVLVQRTEREKFAAQ